MVMYYLAVVGGEVDERFLWKTWGQSGHAEPLIRATDTDWHLKRYLYCQTLLEEEILSNIWLLKRILPIYFPLTPTFIDFDFVFLGTNDIEIAWCFSISIENLNRTQQLNHHLHEVQQFAWILMDFLISVFHVTFISINLISAIQNTVICIVAFFLCVACFEFQCFSSNGFGIGHSC